MTLGQAESLKEKIDSFIIDAVCEDGSKIEDIDCQVLIIHDQAKLIHKDYSLALLHNNTLLVNKGSFAYVDREHLNIVDFKNAGTRFLYQLQAEPKAGFLKLKGLSLSAGASFTQKDINQGLLSFNHNGRSQEQWDLISFSIVNERGKKIGDNALPVRISEDNTAPVFVNCNDWVLHQRESLLVQKEQLFVSDQEQGPEHLQFELLLAPQQGQLKLDAKPLKQGAHFTQEDINQGKLQYTHTSDSLSDDHIAFCVSDGEGGVTPKKLLLIRVLEEGAELPKTASFVGSEQTVRAKQREKNQIFVNEGATILISLTDIDLFSQANMDHNYFTITVKELPEFGKLCKSRAPLKEGMSFRRGEPMQQNDEFTKQELVDGLITYEHKDKSTKEDKFAISIFDERHKQHHVEFIKLSFQKENKPPVLLECHDLLLARGERIDIGPDLLQAVDAEQGPDELCYIIVARPKNGSLTFGGKALSNADTFYQSDINAGKIAYVHSGGEETKDSFTFSISDGQGGSLEKLRIDMTISEDKIVLQHKQPLSVQAGKSAAFNEQHLKVVPASSESPCSFSYVLKRAPQRGRLLLKGQELQETQSFEKDDIINGDLSYEHS